MPRNAAVSSSRSQSNSNSNSSCGSSSRVGHFGDECWTRPGSFINKPARGWLHPDQTVSEGGACYSVRYIGCLEVKASMKSLDFDTRSQVAKESINRVCEAAGLKTADKKRKIEKKISRMLAEKPNMEFAGSNINLTISSSSLNLAIMESGEVIVNHEMPNISFASGGDPDTLDFTAYVAKNAGNRRACYVLECGGGLAQDVITTIGQAFELRFKEYLKKAPRALNPPERIEEPVHNGPSLALGEDPEYYNDLPGKIPPEVAAAPPVPPLPDYHNTVIPIPRPLDNELVSYQLSNSTSVRDSVGNLIDLSSEPSSPNPLAFKKHEPEYVNECMVEAGLNGAVGTCYADRKESTQSQRDPFDMQPFEGSLPPAPVPSSCTSQGWFHTEKNVSVPTLQRKTPSASGQHMQLLTEFWYHGLVGRTEAEAMLLKDGDFLVRESQGSPGQFVLSGMHRGIRKHLLLVDPEGIVRTKDRIFESVSHLVNYHMKNGLPIISAESALVLQNGIARNGSHFVFLN